MSRGFGEPLWLAKAAIVRVPQHLLVKSISDLFDWLDEVDYREPLNSYEIIDRLIQVAATGEYKPNPFDFFGGSEAPTENLEEIPLTEEQQKIVDDFKEQMRDVFGNEENNNEEENN